MHVLFYKVIDLFMINFIAQSFIFMQTRLSLRFQFSNSILLFLIVGLNLNFCNAQNILIKSQRSQAIFVDSVLEYRFEQMMPQMMKDAGIEMWVLISREYNEDPVLKTMLPSSWLSARRRTMLVFYFDAKKNEFEKIAIARYDVGKLMKGNWNIDVYPDQYEALTEYILKKNPKTIGINTSHHFGLADGMIKGEYDLLISHLPTEFHNRIVSAEALALNWLETRSPMEVEFYNELCHISHQIIDLVFDRKNIIIDQTTTDDLVWLLRQKTSDLGLETWFHPTVSIQRNDNEKFDHLRSFSNRPEDQIIREGDLLHVDFGIKYMRLNTDQQQHFYVLKKNEKEVPDFLKIAFEKSNRMQDILTENFLLGRTGNEILKMSLDKAKAEGIQGSIYTHPIGFHGHAAGPTIGLWDQQNGVKGSGDAVIKPNTAFSIELNTASEIKEWNKIIKIMLEEDGIFDGKSFYYPAGRQLKIKAL